MKDKSTTSNEFWLELTNHIDNIKESNSNLRVDVISEHQGILRDIDVTLLVYTNKDIRLIQESVNQTALIIKKSHYKDYFEMVNAFNPSTSAALEIITSTFIFMQEVDYCNI